MRFRIHLIICILVMLFACKSRNPSKPVVQEEKVVTTNTRPPVREPQQGNHDRPKPKPRPRPDQINHAVARVPGWTNSLKPAGTKGPLHKIIGKGGSDYQIVLPANPSPVEQTAAQELQRWLAQMTQVKLPIVNEGKAVIRHGLSIGKTRLLKVSGLKSPNLGEEGYQLHSDPKHIYFVGGSMRGPINAVLAFLEEDLGCRWYGREPSTWEVPRRKELSVAVAQRHSVPAFRQRELYYWESDQPDWNLYNRMNPARAVLSQLDPAWGGGRQYPKGYATHTFHKLVPAATYHKSNPEYYSFKRGKWMATSNGLGTQLNLSNPEVARIASQTVLGVLNDKPDARLFSISQNDGGGLFSGDEKSKAIYKREGSISGALIPFVNQIGDAISKKHPNVDLVTFAYKETAPPPKTTRPRDNVIVELCTDLQWPRRFEPIEKNETFRGYVDGWKKLGSRLYIWDYSVVLGHLMLPLPNMGVMRDNLRYYQKEGVEGVMFQGAYQVYGEGAGRAPMRCWVWSKLMWDPQRDMKALMKDFTYGYFKEAAAPLHAYNEYLYGLWENHQATSSRQNLFSIFPDDFYETAIAFFDEADALVKDETTRNRVEIARMSVMYYLIQQGAGTADQVDRYRKELDHFETLARKHQISRFSEGIRKDRLANLLEQANIRARSVEVHPDMTEGTILVDDLDFYIPIVWKDAVKPVRVADPLARNGFAMQTKNSDRSKQLIYRISEKQFKPGRSYRVEVALRADKTRSKARTDKKGKAFPSLSMVLTGWGSKERVLQKFIYDKDIRSQEYRIFDLGSFVPEGLQKVAIIPGNNLSTGAIYLDYIRFIPE